MVSAEVVSAPVIVACTDPSASALIDVLYASECLTITLPAVVGCDELSPIFISWPASSEITVTSLPPITPTIPVTALLVMFTSEAAFANTCTPSPCVTLTVCAARSDRSNLLPAPPTSPTLRTFTTSIPVMLIVLIIAVAPLVSVMFSVSIPRPAARLSVT